MPSVQHKRGTRAALNAIAAANGLLPGEIYLLTDEQRLVVALTVSTYQAIAKFGEAPAVGSDGWSYATLAADFNESGTSPVAVTGMAIPALASTVYEVEAIGSFQSAAATTGVAMSIAVPAGATVTGMALAPSANNGTVQATSQRSGTVVISPTGAVGTANAAYPISGRWLVGVGATAGDIAMHWRSEVAGSEVRLLAGTVMKMRAVGAGQPSGTVQGFATDAAALAHSQANPNDLAYSTEGL